MNFLSRLRGVSPGRGDGFKSDREEYYKQSSACPRLSALKNKFLSWRNQTDGADNWHTDREREKERQKEIKEGRRQINCQTDWMPGLRVSEIKTGCCSLDMMDFSPPLLSLAKLLQLHARLCRPSGKKGDCFCRGTTVPASYTDWSEGFGKPISPCFKHNKQNGWMYAIVLYLGGGRAEGGGHSVWFQSWSDSSTGIERLRGKHGVRNWVTEQPLTAEMPTWNLLVWTPGRVSSHMFTVTFS